MARARALRMVGFAEPALPDRDDPPFQVVRYEMLLAELRSLSRLWSTDYEDDLEDSNSSASSEDHVGIINYPYVRLPGL